MYWDENHNSSKDWPEKQSWWSKTYNWNICFIRALRWYFLFWRFCSPKSQCFRMILQQVGNSKMEDFAPRKLHTVLCGSISILLAITEQHCRATTWQYFSQTECKSTKFNATHLFRHGATKHDLGGVLAQVLSQAQLWKWPSPSALAALTILVKWYFL